jgi:penicillin-binding protein 1C
LREQGKGGRFREACRDLLIRAGVLAVYWAARSLYTLDLHRGKAALGVALLFLGVLFHRALPDPLFDVPYSTVAVSHDHRLLGARIAADGQWRFPSAPCPPRFAQAAMAFEDSRFRWHPGVDPVAVARAAVKNLKAGEVVSGASTLTMQAVRLSRPGRPRSLGTKISEALLALRLELSCSKEEILSLYASHAPFGGNVVGLPAAAWRYFGRGPETLSWSETALLAVLPNSPALMHPGRNREPLRRKRDRLLERLRNEGVLDSADYALALLEPLPDKPHALPREAPHLVDRLASRTGPGLESPGSRARESTAAAGAVGATVPGAGPAAGQPAEAPAAVWETTLDFELQSGVNRILARKRRGLDGAGIRNAAVLVLHVPTGEALAYVGNMPVTPEDGSGEGSSPGAAPEAGRAVDVAAAPRSTGSLLKPFLYAAMLEAGEILPATLVADVPTSIGGYAPENFDRGFEGAVPAHMALARSLNVPAVRMLRDFGVPRFLHALRALGLTTADRSADDYGLTLVLGGAEGSLWELTGLYAGLAREALRFSRPGGNGQGTGDAAAIPAFFPPRLLASPPGGLPAAGSAARAASSRADASRSPIGPAAAWFALQAMAEASRPDAERHWRSFASSRWVAWKTGTSFGFRDAWAVGVTPEYAVGVWVGNADGQGRPGMTGIEAAAPILFEIFDLLPETSGFPMPMASLRRVAVCRQSGMRPSPHCPAPDSAWIPEAGLRTAACPYHRLVHLDPGGTRRVHDGCQSVSAMRHEPWFVLPPAQEWHYRRRHSDYMPLPPWRSDCEPGALAAGGPPAMDLIYPRGGARIYVPVDLDAERSRTIFEAVHRDPGATVFWHLDQDYLGQTREFHTWAMDPPPGRHTLLLVDDRGERLEHEFEVLAREDALTARELPR